MAATTSYDARRVPVLSAIASRSNRESQIPFNPESRVPSPESQSDFGQSNPALRLVLAFLVLVGFRTRLVALEEQDLRDAFVRVNLGRQRRGVGDLDRDVPFPLGFERRHVD